MRNQNPKKTTAFALVLLVFSNAALAHPGHAQGMAAGLLHPLTGWDHAAAMLAVGVWATQLGERARWAVPLCFVTVMLFAVFAGTRGAVGLPVDAGIAASLLVLGLAVSLRIRMPLALSAAVVGAFAVFHGLAHGMEIPPAANAFSFVSGMLTTTVALHLAGLALGRTLAQSRTLLQLLGAAVAATGGLSLAGVFG